MIKELAKMIDHSLLHPTMTDEELKAGCTLARQYDVASVCIKPYAVKQACHWLAGCDVMVGTVIGFPHGSSATSIKIAETEQACAEGAVEIDMVVNIGRVLGQEWDFVESEIANVLEVCKSHKAALKVIFENDFLPDDDPKIQLCKICGKLSVDFVKTSTGYGMIKGDDGRYGYHGATDHDLKLMREHCPEEVQVKAAGGVRTLDDLLRVKELGVTRVGATATAAIINEAADRFGVERPVTNAIEAKGY